jgi:hypothetical protein
MEGGIGPGHTGQITDPDFRWEIYMDWKSVKERYPDYSAERFARNKGISLLNLEKITKEFKNTQVTLDYGDTTPTVTYENVFILESITRKVFVKKGSDDFFYYKGNKFSSFLEVLNSMDEFVLFTYYHIPLYLDVAFKDEVRTKLNQIFEGVNSLSHDEKWINAWQKALGCKCYLKERSYSFISDNRDLKTTLVTEALSIEHIELKTKLESFLLFLFQAYYPYIELGIDWEKDHQIMKQNKVFSGLLLKYFKVLFAWSKQNLKIRELIPNACGIETIWLERIETSLIYEYESDNKIDYPDWIYDLNENISGAERFTRNLKELFVKSVCAYEYYIHLKKINKSENEALFYSGLHNNEHKSLAEFLIKNYI